MVISICKCFQCHQNSARQVWSKARQWVGLTACPQAFLGTVCGLVHRSSLSGFSCVWLFVIPWTIAHQAPPSMELSRQEYWSGLPFPTPGDLPDPGIEPKSPVASALAGGFFPPEPPGKPIDGQCWPLSGSPSRELHWPLWGSHTASSMRSTVGAIPSSVT